MIPDGLCYTKDHHWVRMEGNLAVVGLTDHALEALGDLTFIEVVKVGRAVKQHDHLAVVESVKAASELPAPVEGTVAAINDAVCRAPETVNQFPYQEGWICKLKGVDKAAVAALLTAEQYRALLAEQ